MARLATFTNTCSSGTNATRYGVRLTVDENSTNVTNNTSNITATLEFGGAYALGLDTKTGYGFYGYNCTGNIYVNGVQKVSSTSQPTINSTTIVTLATWTGDVEHNADGSLTIPITGEFTGGLSRQATYGTTGGSVTFTTIPRASSVSCSTTSIGSKPTITISSASSSFTHSLFYSFGSLSGTIVSQTNLTSYTSWTIPTSFYDQIPNANSGTGTITCNTYSGSTLIGTKTCSFTANVPASATPTVTAPTYSDTDSISKDTIGLYVVGKSKLKFDFSNSFKSNYSANLKSYTLKINGTQVYSGMSTSYTMTSALPKASNTYELIVTDTRSKTATTGSKTITAYAYSSPTCSISASRNSDKSTTTDITYSASITNINSNNKNAKKILLEYKKAVDTTWKTLTTITDSYSKASATYSVNDLSDSYSYDFRISVSDSYSTSISAVSIGTTFTLLNFNDSGKSMAFGKASEASADEELLEIELDTKYKGMPLLEYEVSNMANIIQLKNDIYLSSQVYSTDELKIGLWINKKPIYRKVIDIGSLPNSTYYKDVSHNIDNLEQVVDITVVAKTSGGFFYTINMKGTDAIFANNTVAIRVNSTKIQIGTTADYSTHTAYVVLEYTKTTD